MPDDFDIAGLLSLKSQVALVTGAGAGIGEAIARMLAAAGAHVVVSDIDDDGAARVAAAIGGTAAHLDVTDPGQAASVIESLGAHGGLDVLVNNAGTYREAGSILDQSHESWRRSLDVNLVGLFNCSKPAAAMMVAQGRGGSIVNIGSVDGLLPAIGTSYDTFKGALIQFTRSLAVDVAPHGIRVNAVSPGATPVRTTERMKTGELAPLWPADSSNSGLMGPLFRQRSSNLPLGRKGRPEEAAHAVLFLCSRAASYITGHNLIVDGGWTLI